METLRHLTAHQIYGCIAIILGIFGIITGKIGYGALQPRPTGYITGPSAVLGGFVLIGIGIWFVLT
jgi:hypothetical protein